MAVKLDLSHAKEYAINTHNDVFRLNINKGYKFDAL